MRPIREDNDVDQKKQDTFLLIAALLGLALAVLSGLAEHVDVLRSWCAWFSDGCRATASFTLFGIHLWILGAVFYVLLVAAVIFSRNLLALLIPAAVGVEIVLLGVMAYLGAACVFCLGNAVVVGLLAALFIRKDGLWRALALALAAVIVSGALLARENNLLPLYCARNVPASAPPRIEIPLDGSQVYGPADAPVTVVEFSDFRCPACRRMHKTVAGAMKHYGDKVRWVFKNFPLPSHKDARIAAEGALCAAGLGKFREYHDILFEAEEEFTPDSLTAIAGKLGLDAAAFRQCLDAGTHKAQVDKEVKSGLDAGLDAVPSTIVNGVLVVGAKSPEALRAIIDAELAARRGK